MRVRKAILAACLWHLVCTAQAGFYSGNDLVKWLDSYDRVQQDRASAQDAGNASTLMGYVTGITEALHRMDATCPPGNMRIRQVVALTKAELQSAPEQWHEDGDLFVGRALMKAYPCVKR